MRGIFHRMAVLLILAQAAGTLLLPPAASATALPPDWHLPNSGSWHFTSTITSPQLTGHVFNDDGSPYINGSGHVEALRLGTVVAMAPIDSSNGTYEMVIYPGVYDIKFVDGLSNHPFDDLVVPNVNVAPTRILDATFTRSPHQLSGRVLDANNVGIPGVTVHLSEPISGGNGHVYDTTTDSAGSYSLSVAGGIYNAVFSGESSDSSALPQSYGFTKQLDLRKSDVTLDVPFVEKTVQLSVYDVDNNALGDTPVSSNLDTTAFHSSGYSFVSAGQTNELGEVSLPMLSVPSDPLDQSAISVHIFADGQDTLRSILTKALGDATFHAPDLDSPAQVGTISATNNNTASVALSWQADPNASSYKVFRNGLFLGQTSESNYSDTLPNEGSFNYLVQAQDADGDPSGSNTASVTYDVTPPVLFDPVAVSDPIPYDSYIFDDNNRVLNGSFPGIVVPTEQGSPNPHAIVSAEYFRADLGTEPAPGHGIRLVPNPPLPNLQTPEFHLNPGHYTYGFRGRDNAGTWSATKYITLNVVDAREPLNVTTEETPTSSYPVITWAAGSEAVRYTVARDGQNLGSTTGTSFTDTTISSSGSHQYSVRGVDAQGNSAFLGSNDSVFVEYDQPFTVGPVAFSAKPKATNQTITLSAPVGVPAVAAEYYIGTDPGIGNGTPMSYANGVVTATIGTDLPAGSGDDAYQIYVRAEDASGVWSSAPRAFLDVVEPVAPTISSDNSASVNMRAPFDFTVSADGFPAPTITESGALPNGITLTDNGNGTAELSGMAVAGSAGTYPITITASNGTGDPATQAFTLTVSSATSAPGFVSANSDTETYGVPFSFTVQTSGYPVPAITKIGTMPGGVTFTNNGDGTATIAGTPTAGGVGVHNYTFKAKSSAGTVTQAFTLNITNTPVFKAVSVKSETGTVLAPFSLTVTAKGYTVPSIAESGTLPNGVSFVDNGNGTATFAGTPAIGGGGAYPVTLSASNSNGTTTKNITLFVDEAPLITSDSSATATVGSSFSFQVSATGYPVPKYTLTGTLPAGLTFHAGTGVLGGTAHSGTAGTYNLTISASNSAGANNQNFVLTVQ